MRGGDAARGETDALYVSFRVPTNAKPGQQKGVLARPKRQSDCRDQRSRSPSTRPACPSKVTCV